MRRSLAAMMAGSVLLISGCGDAGGTGAEGPATASTDEGLTCPSDVRAAAIYDYGDEPDPDAADARAAVEAFFGAGLPEGATLTADGSEVTVMDGDAAVATIELMSVSGGYVVASYQACEGVLPGP